MMASIKIFKMGKLRIQSTQAQTSNHIARKLPCRITLCHKVNTSHTSKASEVMLLPMTREASETSTNGRTITKPICARNSNPIKLKVAHIKKM